MKILTSHNCLIRSTGPIDAPALICLAGYADNGTMFLPLFTSSLTEKFQVITIDLPGTGGSPAKENINTIEDYAKLVGAIVTDISAKQSGLIGHSIASPICVSATKYCEISGLFSIEGNLTEDDAYFTGRAAKYDTYEEFWTAQRMHIKAIGIEDPILQRYFAAATFADPKSMWLLGRDAVRLSVNDGFGHEFLQARCKTHYFWSADNTPEKTQNFITENNISNSTYSGSHWPTIDRTAKTAAAIDEFFSLVFSL